MQWLQGTLLGTVAMTVAVMAIAWIGLMMLSGRIHYRRSVTVILGCFVIFGASSIVAGVTATVSGSRAPQAGISPSIPQPETPRNTPANPAPPAPRSYDPYAGASVP
ncbi:TrbC/VirB2 family protein [Sphingomonas sp. QA11]|uniref:TrbC/VirB2 family protein n=1 Tax=Sphingomonas sp. QA11 TaxID=2950605 RepID=UPI003FA73DFB